jgi:hypothetical protein
MAGAQAPAVQHYQVQHYRPLTFHPKPIHCRPSTSHQHQQYNITRSLRLGGLVWKVEGREFKLKGRGLRNWCTAGVQAPAVQHYQVEPGTSCAQRRGFEPGTLCIRISSTTLPCRYGLGLLGWTVEGRGFKFKGLGLRTSSLCDRMEGLDVYNITRSLRLEASEREGERERKRETICVCVCIYI